MTGETTQPPFAPQMIRPESVQLIQRFARKRAFGGGHFFFVRMLVRMRGVRMTAVALAARERRREQQRRRPQRDIFSHHIHVNYVMSSGAVSRAQRKPNEDTA